MMIRDPAAILSLMGTNGWEKGSRELQSREVGLHRSFRLQIGRPGHCTLLSPHWFPYRTALNMRDVVGRGTEGSILSP